MPARLSTFHTVECAKPVAPATKARSPAGLATAVADPLLQRDREQPRRAMWPARTVNQGAHLAAAVEPAMPPAMRRRRRNAESRRGSPQRQTLLDRSNKREPTSQSELGVSVQQHPSPPLRVVSGKTHSLKGGPDRTSAVHNLCRRDT